MSHSIDQINHYLVSIFNEVLDIEEDALKGSEFSDISISEMHTIEAIDLYAEHTSSEVAKKLAITAGTLSVAIRSLVNKGYVVRQRMEDDRRVVKLGLTKKGKLVYRLHNKFHREMVKRTIEGMEEDEVEVLLKGLKNLHGFLFELVENIEKRD
ncbi:MarR family winged helix-turn-helix transcriptional regulator [Jeotgalibaca porci]|uniref:Winged helix-turn-helix transcriptional regulator n=1 Tax=Jeotgalibaca porci TaxID=1868793 RepID=A0A6G7WEN8_9LACT|nr:MarR family winged helix-turn-helix transcriptional regulator [Jeotgalibaca porci]NLB98169.1 winged helix-turn-helix transcriptional regulator [Lactobacillales bacterium]QIK50638.1 winged helix-turn-helix transcriptional regulator [Jeotgalibaca porci]